MAGLSAGIALRLQDVPVNLFESREYPRHKVCGEFMSGIGLDLLPQLGLKLPTRRSPIKTISFHHRSRDSKSFELPEPGLALSRFDLDFALARRFTELAGELKCPYRFGVPGSAGEAESAEGVVWATGRRLQKGTQWKWYGLKAHVLNVNQRSDLELHFFNDGYAGLCRLDDQRSNLCGLFRRRIEASTPNHSIEEHFTAVPSLAARLTNAEWDRSSFSAVSGLPLGKVAPRDESQFAIGDAFSMIPPFTGNGMSIALESAFLGAAPLAAYSRGKIPWKEAVAQYHEKAERAFKTRLGIATVAQAALMSRICRPALMTFAARTAVWKNLFSVTR